VAISTVASLLSLREESARPLSRILRSANRMGRMISQLLDFTRTRLGAGIRATGQVFGPAGESP
jgi:signal transduction histidine kinase